VGFVLLKLRPGGVQPQLQRRWVYDGNLQRGILLLGRSIWGMDSIDEALQVHLPFLWFASDVARRRLDDSLQKR